MFLCCCPSKVNQEQPENGDPDLEQNKQGRLIFNGNYESRLFYIFYFFLLSESWSGSVNKMLYNRIGRVEKFKHGSKFLV